MNDLRRRELKRIRRTGVDVFVIPGPGEVSGMAWCTLADRLNAVRFKRHINIIGDTDHPTWLFVLFHEVAHHLRLDTNTWNSLPVWVKEHTADEIALELLLPVEPHNYDACAEAHRNHIRPMLQAMIDAEIWHHVDLDIALWAGCDIPEESAEDLLRWETARKGWREGPTLSVAGDSTDPEGEIPF